MSLPCILGSNGVEFMVRQDLSSLEKEKLQQSADAMNEIQKKLPLGQKKSVSSPQRGETEETASAAPTQQDADATVPTQQEGQETTASNEGQGEGRKSSADDDDEEEEEGWENL